jgi:hypothetical protein
MPIALGRQIIIRGIEIQPARSCGSTWRKPAKWNLLREQISFSNMGSIMSENPTDLTIKTSEDGSKIIFTAKESSLAVPSSKLADFITLLISALGHPLVTPHAPPLTPLPVGKTAQVRPLPLVGVKVTKVFLVDAIGLFLDLAGGLRLYFQFSPEKAILLAEQLQKVAEQVKQSEPESKN